MTATTERSPLWTVWIAIAGLAVAVSASFVLMMIVFVFGTPARHRLDQQQHDNTCLTLQSRPSDHSSLANRLRRETTGCPKATATPSPSHHRTAPHRGKTKRQATARTPIATAPARGPQTPSTVTAARHRPTTRPSAVRPPTAATPPPRPVTTPPAPGPTGSSAPGLLGGVVNAVCGTVPVPLACPR